MVFVSVSQSLWRPFCCSFFLLLWVHECCFLLLGNEALERQRAPRDPLSSEHLELQQPRDVAGQMQADADHSNGDEAIGGTA